MKPLPVSNSGDPSGRDKSAEAFSAGREHSPRILESDNRMLATVLSSYTKRGIQAELIAFAAWGKRVLPPPWPALSNLAGAKGLEPADSAMRVRRPASLDFRLKLYFECLSCSE